MYIYEQKKTSLLSCQSIINWSGKISLDRYVWNISSLIETPILWTWISWYQNQQDWSSLLFVGVQLYITYMEGTGERGIMSQKVVFK